MAHTPVNRILAGAVAPVVIYSVGSKMDMAMAGALLASIWSLGVLGWYWTKQREFDGFSGIGAAYGVSELAGLLVTQNPEWFLLSPVISDWVLGGVFLVSMLTPRPLIQVLAEQTAGKEAFEQVCDSEYYRPLWLRMSLIWGGAYVLKGALAWAILSTMPEDVYLVARMVLGWPVIAALMAFSFWYPKRYWNRVLS